MLSAVIDSVLDVDNARVFRFGLVLITTGFFYHAISNDDELAALLGHEVAHVLARHILEANFVDLAHETFTKPFSWFALLGYIWFEAIVFAAPMMASLFASLALSRVREREADYIGLLLMADAGFNPSGALSLWTKVNRWEEQQRRAKKGRQQQQFTSTHPHVSLLVLLEVTPSRNWGCLRSLSAIHRPENADIVTHVGTSMKLFPPLNPFSLAHFSTQSYPV